MKILQINSVCGIGSTGRIATDIHDILIKQKHESYIAFGRDSAKNCNTNMRVGTICDNYAHVLLTRLFDRHGFGSRKATRDFIEKIDEIDPDVIHLHNIHGYYLNIGTLFAYLKTSGKPVVWTLHDCWSFTGHCSHFSYIKCNKWLQGCENCPQHGAYPTSFLMDSSKSNYQRKKEIFTSPENMTIVTPSRWLADLVRQSFLSKYPVRVIYNGIDTLVFKPVDIETMRKKYELQGKFIILSVANIWNRGKGFDYFLRLSEIIDSDCVIMLIGLNSQQIARLPHNIVGIKKTADLNELAQFYTLADVFVNLTLEDNFPTVNIEALACGTPIIVFNTGGSSEAVCEGCGYVVRIGDIYAVKRFIDRVKAEGKRLFTERCINSAKTMFEKSERYNEYLDLYKCLNWDKG